MDEKDQRIIELKAEGKSLREIAEAVGTSHVAVKKRLNKVFPHPVEMESELPAEIIDVSEFPDIQEILTQIDFRISRIDTRIGVNLGKNLDTIITPNGWKIERVPINSDNRS